jgi:Ulp1 family protease
MIKHVKFCSFEKFLVPIHINDNHWALVMLLRETREIIAIDSQNNEEHRDSLSQACEKLKIYFEKKMASEWRIVLPKTSVPQQTNDNDCGVFMCQFMKCIVNGELMTHVRQRDMLYYRKKMILELVSLTKQ